MWYIIKNTTLTKNNNSCSRCSQSLAHIPHMFRGTLVDFQCASWYLWAIFWNHRRPLCQHGPDWECQEINTLGEQPSGDNWGKLEQKQCPCPSGVHSVPLPRLSLLAWSLVTWSGSWLSGHPLLFNFPSLYHLPPLFTALPRLTRKFQGHLLGDSKLRQ